MKKAIFTVLISIFLSFVSVNVMATADDYNAIDLYLEA